MRHRNTAISPYKLFTAPNSAHFAGIWQLPIARPLDAFLDVPEFLVAEEVADDIVGSPHSLSSPVHSISQGRPHRCFALAEWTISA